MPPDTVELWTSGSVKPLGKQDGKGVRPITLFETVLKLATGLALAISKKDIIKAVGEFQYEGLMSSGADKMVYNLRGLANSKPSHVFIASDVKNAFGTVQRIIALNALLKHLPFLSPIMSLLWSTEYNTLLVPNGPNFFGQLLITEGVLQGECLSTAVFCIFLRFVVATFYTELAVATKGKVPDAIGIRFLITILAYYDDVVLCCQPEHLDIIWPLWIKVLKDHSLEVEPKKCKVLVPQKRHVDATIDALVPVVTSRLPVLGTVARAKHSTLITNTAHPIPMAGLLADVTVRSQQVDNDAELHIHMVETTCEVPVPYAAWLMLVRSLAVRLDFDMRMLPASLLTPIITAHIAMLFRVTKHILGHSKMTDVMLVQMQMPCQSGEMFLTNPMIKLQVAHFASMAISWNHIRLAATAGPD